MIVAGRLPILIVTKPVDFRCGHQALALMVTCPPEVPLL
jgi:transposase